MYLSKDGQAVSVKSNGKTMIRVPLHNLDSICCVARVGISPYLMAICAELGVTISFLTSYGKFLGAAVGFTPGNVMLRRQQYRLADCPTESLKIARWCILGKLANTRTSLLRSARELNPQKTEQIERIRTIVKKIDGSLHAVKNCETIESSEDLKAKRHHYIFLFLVI